MTSAPWVDAPARAKNYITRDWSLRSWLLTVDHKRIAILYLISVTVFFFIGGLFAVLIRLELLTPAGDLLSADTYNRMFTQHGVVMIFFFLIPSIPAVFGNFVLPLMLGTIDVAFPRLNLASWYVYSLGGLFAMAAILLGGVDTGWTFYSPFSSVYSNSQVFLAALGVFITGFSSILTGLNFLVTIHRMRAPGLTWFKLPLFVWAMYATSLINILGTPVVAITILLVALERVAGLGIFDPTLGGDPVLFQHLFWFYSHPAVYIMILPSMGVVSEVISAFSRRPVFGYRFVAFSSLGIAVLGFLVWAHHMFTTGMSVYAATVFSVLTMLIAVPTAVKVINWIVTMYKGSVAVETPMLFAIGFIGLFTIGGLTGLMLATLGINPQLHDTYFVVAHFHFVMVGGAIMGFMAALHYWWPKISGHLYPGGWSKTSAVMIFAGFILTFFPQFILGYLGMPRRYHAYPEEFQALNVLSTAGASILGVGYLLPAIYLTWSLYSRKRAPANPWGAAGLEWQCPSPPPVHNFDTPPIITDVYDYQDERLRADIAARVTQEVSVG
ncbi:MAG TPA: cytochrome c oxidase subunit I [Thermoanaerobaculia bacterium]|nr:cytochrome c oxidase subunit I [Thermoanaerobaculia bacterium]